MSERCVCPICRYTWRAGNGRPDFCPRCGYEFMYEEKLNPRQDQQAQVQITGEMMIYAVVAASCVAVPTLFAPGLLGLGLLACIVVVALGFFQYYRIR